MHNCSAAISTHFLFDGYGEHHHRGDDDDHCDGGNDNHRRYQKYKCVGKELKGVGGRSGNCFLIDPCSCLSLDTQQYQPICSFIFSICGSLRHDKVEIVVESGRFNIKFVFFLILSNIDYIGRISFMKLLLKLFKPNLCIFPSSICLLHLFVPAMVSSDDKSSSL